VSDPQFSRRVDRFAATLCFLVAAIALAIVGLSVIDFSRGCAVFRHGCFYVAIAAPLFLLLALCAVGAGFWMWPRTREATPNQAPDAR